MQPLSPWRVLSSEHLQRDGWISLRADRCVTDEGVEVVPYYVLEYPDWVHVVAVDQDRRVLLVEQYRHGAAAVTLELPAGRMDSSDASVEATACRELLEETGCAGQDFAVVNSSSPNPASHNNRVHTVLATGVEHREAPVDDPRERLRTTWVSRGEAFSLATQGVLPAMQAASVFSAFQHLGWLTLAV